LAKEVSLGAMAGPFPDPPPPGMHFSRFSLLEKPDKSGWRLLFDLSYPRGFSVNDGISKENSTVKYSKLSDVCDEVLRVGKGALICKFDIRRAYRQVPVSVSDRRLLGLSWAGSWYIDLTLSFGGRPCCAIFNRVGDLFTSIFNRATDLIRFYHYLDDFIGVLTAYCRDSPDRGQQAFQSILDACSEMGIPLASNKTVPPCTILTYLGFELDTVALTVSLPLAKRDAYITAIREVKVKRSVTKHMLESLLGKLHHASTVVSVGRAFFRSLINKVTVAPSSSSFISLSKDERLNLDWWVTLLSQWNGISLMSYCRWEPIHDLAIASDAASSEGLGLGIVLGTSWTFAPWPSTAPPNIAVLELIAIVVGAALWGHLWHGKSVLFLSDSMAAVFSAESLLPADRHLAALVRELAIISVTQNFKFEVRHVPGKNNVLSDLLSRGKLRDFHALHPLADALPTQLPLGLLERLCLLSV
jgi:xanthosine utilization system XapX-like protein